MKTYIQDLKDMTDSREMLEAKPNSFMTWFIYILIALIMVALTWSYFGQIEDYVKANGTVRPGDSISSIRNTVSGRVDQNNLEEGKIVKKGDVLYTLEIEGALIEKNEYENQVKRLEIENSNLLKFKQSINEEKNVFDKNNKDEVDYYNRYQKYEIDKIINIEQYANQGLDIDQLRSDSKLSLKMAQSNLSRANKILAQQKLLEKSISERKNLMDKNDVEYYNRYIDYSMNLERLEMAKQRNVNNYTQLKKLYDVGGVSQKELEEAKNQMDIAILDLDGYVNEYIMNLKTSMIQSGQSIDEITGSIQKSQSVMNTFGDKEQDNDIMLEKMRLDALVQTDDSLIVNRNNLNKTKSALKSLELSIQEATVTAPINGIINLYSEINTGDYLQNGVEIAVIVPDTATENKVQLMVKNEDIAEVKVGQKIKFHFLALPYREYGEADGIVKKISTDARVDSEAGISYYVVEATIENNELESYKGITKEIKVGMVCEAQVVTGSRKVIRWLLEKVNLLD